MLATLAVVCGSQPGVAQPVRDPSAATSLSRHTGPLGRDYWLIAPPPKSAQPRWLVVLVHGFRGRGQDTLWLRRAFAACGECVFVAPSFVEGYQLLGARADVQLIGVIEALRKRLQLHAKVFVCGFSGGAQFSHRFTMKHPERVIGCGAHAGGTWGPAINPAARGIPLAVSCGLDDVARSSLGQVLTRAQAAHRYFVRLTRAGMWVKPRLWQGLGHETSAAVEAHFAECFTLATKGLYASHSALLQGALARWQGGDEKARQALRAARFPLLGPKAVRRAIASVSDRRRHAVQFETLGLGGRSALGPSYWVDDTRENQAGWSASPTAERQRQRRLRAHLTSLREALSRGSK